MAKDNLFLGMARGSVGDVTFSRLNGVQVSRARNRAPKNPQSALQLVQRVCLKTVAQAYSLMQELCDHSFQGLMEGTPNQSRFMKVNLADLRQRLAAEINSGDAVIISSSEKTNFAAKDTSLPVINDYIVSEGTLSPLPLSTNGTGDIDLNFNQSFDHLPTYADVIAGLGVQRGDQLTIVMLTTDDTDGGELSRGCFTGFKYARIILEPAGGDLSVPFTAGNAVNDPNPRNEGEASVLPVQSGQTGEYAVLKVGVVGAAQLPGKTNSAVAGTVILSRLTGSIWQRSTQRLLLADETVLGGFKDFMVWPLGDAVMSFVTEANSSLYLNQAENFG